MTGLKPINVVVKVSLLLVAVRLAGLLSLLTLFSTRSAGMMARMTRRSSTVSTLLLVRSVSPRLNSKFVGLQSFTVHSCLVLHFIPNALRFVPDLWQKDQNIENSENKC